MTQGGWKTSALCGVLVVLAFAACVPLSALVPYVKWEIKPEYGDYPPVPGDLWSAKNPEYDRSRLPVIIAAIVGSYVATIIIVCVFILTIGRRLRRATQASSGTLAMEIMKPVPLNKPSTDNPWGPSPISPAKESIKWPSPKVATSGWGNFSKHRYQESVKSVATFDESVIEEDKAKNEMEMDRLYAAVAVHEEQRKRAAGSVASDGPSSPRSPLSAQQQQQQYPPELQHLRYAHPPPPPIPTSQHDNIRVNITQQYATTDSQFQPQQQQQPPSRTSTKSPRRLNKPSPIPISSPASASISRTSSRSSFASLGRKKPVSIRDLTISNPIASPDWETEPPTPRVPPSAPAGREAFGSVELESGRRFHFAPSIHSVRSGVGSVGASPAQTPRMATFPLSAHPQYPQSQQRQAHVIREQPSREDAAQPPRSPRYRHRPQPSDASEYLAFNFQLDEASVRSTSPPPSVHSSRSGTRGARPAPLPLSGTSTGAGDAISSAGNAGFAGSAARSNASLTLRTAPLPLRALRSPMSQRPPSMIRATEIERPERRRNNLLSPGTAGMVPATPYSPYMPMTPLTPMTPSRLVTREERKRMKKEEGRRVLTQEDAVPEEADLWGDGY